MLEFEPTLSESYQMVFEGCFENNVEEQIVCRMSGDEVIVFDFKDRSIF